MYTIVSGCFERGTPEQQAAFIQLFGTENTQYKFDLYFHWYNIVHELGHCLLAQKGIKLSPVQEEMTVNLFAVAYWRQIGFEKRIIELTGLLENILSMMPSPVPQGESFTGYFEKIFYTPAMSDPMLYGYFQLISVLEAVKAGKTIREVLGGLNISIAETGCLQPYDGPVTAENAHHVLANALENLKLLGLDVGEVTLELVNDPGVQQARME